VQFLFLVAIMSGVRTIILNLWCQYSAFFIFAWVPIVHALCLNVSALLAAAERRAAE
jgi:hypothetical protein